MRSPQGLFARHSWSRFQCRAFSSSPAARAPNSKNKLPNGPARTRFAPSPTGYLHLGSLRTALFNYLLAKRTGGQFLLRIEDTDQKRTIPGAEQRLYDDLQWAGLNWDEGPVIGGPYGPYRQSERTALYQSHANDLISNGHAYRCFCSAERLDSIARHRSQAGLPPGYDRKCGDISAEESEDRAAKGESHIIRLKVEEYPMFNDLVYGKSGQNRLNNSKLDFIDRVYNDPVLIKSDGHPTYHLANVVDDHCMKITHVIRGTEWMASTPMHMALYNAFKWTPPSFAHVPLLVDRSGQKLSKRNADIDLSSFRDQQGIFPATLVNFASLLGWSHSEKSDVLSLKELEQIFNLKITRGNTVVSFEKLQFLQKAHIQRLVKSGGPEFDEMVKKVSSVVEESYPLDELATILKGRTLSEYIAPLIRADVNSYTDAKEFAERNSVFFTPKLSRAPYKPVSPQPSPEVPIQALHTAAAALTLVPPSAWNIETHRDNINSYDGAESIIITASESEISIDPKSAGKIFKKELYHYLRWALSASAPGPGISETMVVLGRDETLRRVQDAKALTQSLVPSAGRRVPKGTLPEDQSWMGSLATNR
ncbi:Aminoacyl-tRNA synthetase, class I, anticodon-binding domain, subdomain 2 [Penicillium griseofulvum]|uniref:Glutamate--tRNA ligase, mitochondrial n=1 Tax=Penicillium patulum TaxID=5078 RepID=A0A135LFU4_PENPA|nr:Aminoacyl-tRNA synthetase, class I, anticodon-binding domain, subdomain 2 [Penicillium griseofulvum]KXG47852.1 Aminoacyl-tRNA synthetase, class I, anticodon-binding domain, subdomain 2 [Penicillium griseofulvum]